MKPVSGEMGGAYYGALASIKFPNQNNHNFLTYLSLLSSTILLQIIRKNGKFLVVLVVANFIYASAISF
jgi:hypothetical protein